jgi:Fe-S cluster biosynthesis and repair protein YggX
MTFQADWQLWGKMRLFALEEWFSLRLRDKYGEYMDKIEAMVKNRHVTELTIWLIPEEHRERFKWDTIEYAGWHVWKNNKTQLIKVHVHDVSDKALEKYISQNMTMAKALMSTSRTCVLQVTYEHCIVPRIKNIVEVTMD